MATHPCAFPCLAPGCCKYYITRSSLARHVRRSHVEAASQPILRGRKAGRGGAKTRGKENRRVRVSPRTKKSQGNRPVRVSPRTSQSEVDVYYCNICNKTWFRGLNMFKKHLASHGKKVWHDECEVCNQVLETPEEAVRHYVEEHLNAEFVS